MKTFLKKFLLSSFLLIFFSNNSFADFKISQDFETVSDYTSNSIKQERFNIPSKRNSEFQFRNDYQESQVESQNDYKNIQPYDEYFINSNNSKTIAESPQIQPQNIKKITKTKKIVKVLNNKKSLTIGNYFGIDYLNANLRFREMSIDNEVYPYNSPDLKNGFGLKYFYAVNFNNLFLAPEIFYEKIGVKNKYSYNRFSAANGSDTLTDNRTLWGYKFMEIHQRFGGKINLGYDFNSNFAPYIFGGLSYIDFSNLASPYTIDQRNQALQVYGYDVFQIKKGRKLVPFFGYGLKIKLSNRFYLNAEYHILDFMVKTKSTRYTPLDNAESSKNADFINLDNSLRIFKAGLLYNF